MATKNEWPSLPPPGLAGDGASVVLDGNGSGRLLLFFFFIVCVYIYEGTAVFQAEFR